VQRAPESRFAAVASPLCVHGVTEIVRAMHVQNVTVHNFGSLSLCEGHNIAK